MTPNMDALMTALKRREGSAGLDGMGRPPAAAKTPGKPSGGLPEPALGIVIKTGSAKPGDDTADPADTDEQDDGDDAAMNAKIVDVLQSSYPKIFARISSMIEDEPDANDGGAAPPTTEPEMMG